MIEKFAYIYKLCKITTDSSQNFFIVCKIYKSLQYSYHLHVYEVESPFECKDEHMYAVFDIDIISS